MSPYVWRHPTGEYLMLFRVVGDRQASTGSLWLARGNGLTFTLDSAPVLTPGPEPYDIGGCEDPTVVHTGDDCLVYYTGIDAEGVAQLCWAEGADIGSLKKRGVAHASTASDRNTKEAAVEQTLDHWLLLFEYSRDGHSRIGRAEASRPNGPWRETPDPVKARSGQWDNWHLSTGPLLIDQPHGPTMFYNGSDADAVWQIGWVTFDETCQRVVRRGEYPLVGAPERPGPDGRRIAFAASAVDRGEELWLYFTVDDRRLRRAIVRPIAR